MRKLLLSFIVILFAFSNFPIHNEQHVQANAAESLVVHASVLNLRTGPGLSYAVVTKLSKGEKLQLISVNGEWFKVKAKGKTGWVASWMTRTVQSETSNTATAQVVISNVDRLNFRLQASVSSTVLAQLNKGNQAKFVKQTGDWIQVEYNQQLGWVSKQYVTIQQSNNTNQTATTNTTVKYFTVNVAAVNIREQANLNSKKLGTIRLNESFEVLKQDGNWIQIEYAKNKKGWVYSFYGSFSSKTVATSSKPQSETITIVYNGTNLRAQASTSSNVVARVNAGEQYTVTEVVNDWFKIQLKNGSSAYVANWVVNSSNKTVQSTQPATSTKRKAGTLNGLTIVIDPGHGGNDHGTTGVLGTAEKTINIQTAEKLKSKLQSAGANVIMTRESDKYVDLRKRVSISHQYNADAFISIHYDASDIASVRGFTTYYTNSNQKALAQAIHKGLSGKSTLRDRGVQQGNYLVLRENRQPAILLELGFLSNRTEEQTVANDYYREQATQGIYNGLINYFNAKLN